jgi:AcrR family transcriptional regulator
MLYALSSMPRPRSLTPSGIATAALAVIDREGLAALSMRAVADELGVGTMSLYRYVDDREQLEKLVVDLVLSRVDPVPPARASWSRQVTILLERVRDVVSIHSATVPLLLTHRHTAEASLHWTEELLGVLTRAGFTGRRRVIAFRGLLSYLVGALQTEHFGPLSGPGTAIMARLPLDQFPLLADTARHAQRVAPENEFRGGLAILLRGLRVEVSQSASATRHTG